MIFLFYIISLYFELLKTGIGRGADPKICKYFSVWELYQQNMVTSVLLLDINIYLKR